MKDRPINVFFYGLFMDADVLRANGLHPHNVRQASVSGMALRIGRRATLVPDPTKCVHGFVIGLAHSDVERLYAESGVAEYRPEAVIAQLPDRSCIAALCFNLPSPDETVAADPDYVEKLRVVATRLGLPADYATGIGQASKSDARS